MLQLFAYTQGTDIVGGGNLPLTQLDLYDNEPLPLSLSIDNFINIAENSAGYSQVFKMPGTKVNNKFFNHIWKVEADSTFNPHKQTNVILKDNSSDIFVGFMQLTEILNKENVISYNVILFSSAVNLKDLLSGKLMRDLDFSELNHNYTSTEIKSSWITGLPLINTLPANSFAGSGNSTTVLKYPFVRWNTNSVYNSGTNTISFPVKYDVFRPWINIKYIIQNMFRDVGYTITSTFFTSNKFTKLFTDFHRGYDTGGAVGGTGQQFNTNNSVGQLLGANAIVEGDVVVNGGQFGGIDGNNYYSTSTFKFTATDNAPMQVNLNPFIITMPSGSSSVQVYLYKNNSLFTTIFNGTVVSGQQILAGVFLNTLIGDVYEIRISGSGSLRVLTTSSNVTWSVFATTQFMNDSLQGYKGDTNQWAFVKGIIDMFKLLVMPNPNNPTDVIIEPYNDWVDTGNTLDWTNKVDIRDVKLNPISPLSKNLTFRLKEDSPDWTTLNNNYPNTWQWPMILNNDIDIFEETEEIFEVSNFSSTKFGYTLGGNLPIPSIINDNTSLDIWPNVWRILYDNGVKTMATVTYSSYQFPSESDYLLFSPVSDVPYVSTSQSTDFGVVAYWGLGTILNGRYNTYWARYIDELYHKDTKILKIKMYLKGSDILNFDFNDIILLKNRKYRVKSIDYRANQLSRVELITIKDL